MKKPAIKLQVFSWIGIINYNWNGNVYNAAGTFNITLINSAGCDSIAILVLNLKTLLPFPTLGNNMSLCPGDSLILFPGIYNSYVWQDFSVAPIFKVIESGNYEVIVTDGQGCTGKAKISINYLPSCGDIYFPTAITPNGDGLNDKFGALGNLYSVENYSLFIYNRYGELVFSTNNPYQKWDGIYKSSKVDISGFTWYSRYRLNSGNYKIQKGYLVIIR